MSSRNSSLERSSTTSTNYSLIISEKDCKSTLNVSKIKFQLENKENMNYNIIFDKEYCGIKKRNTPDEERQKYVINISNIVNLIDLRTTLMIKNIPINTTQVQLLELINRNHASIYNFLYLPIDFHKKTNAGYAFINFRNPKLIISFFLEFDRKPWDLKNSKNKLCYISYARIQGFRSLSDHFKRSNIMKQTDEKLKPIILD